MCDCTIFSKFLINCKYPLLNCIQNDLFPFVIVFSVNFPLNFHKIDWKFRKKLVSKSHCYTTEKIYFVTVCVNGGINLDEKKNIFLDALGTILKCNWPFQIFRFFRPNFYRNSNKHDRFQQFKFFLKFSETAKNSQRSSRLSCLLLFFPFLVE